MRPIDMAVAEVRTITDPRERLIEADRLDAALTNARSALARVRSQAINELRTPAFGYGGIARGLGLTKARVQQLANLPRGPVPAAYAFQDTNGQWYGEPDLLPVGSYQDLAATNPFAPADPYNPLYGHQFVFRCADLPDNSSVSLYSVQVAHDAGPRAVRMTEAVGDALFGPSDTASSAHVQWQQARERRRQETVGEA